MSDPLADLLWAGTQGGTELLGPLFLDKELKPSLLRAGEGVEVGDVTNVFTSSSSKLS